MILILKLTDPKLHVVSNFSFIEALIVIQALREQVQDYKIPLKLK